MLDVPLFWVVRVFLLLLFCFIQRRNKQQQQRNVLFLVQTVYKNVCIITEAPFDTTRKEIGPLEMHCSSFCLFFHSNPNLNGTSFEVGLRKVSTSQFTWRAILHTHNIEKRRHHSIKVESKIDATTEKNLDTYKAFFVWWAL